MTGRFPGSFNDSEGNPARENLGAIWIEEISDEVRNTTIAAFLKRAGYDLVYGGKEHLPDPLAPKALGFNNICDNQREKLAQETAKFIKSKHDKPYFMVVSLINPHDICFMVRKDFEYTEAELESVRKRGKIEIAMSDKAMEIPEGVSEEEFFEKYCPPLPPNFEPQKDEPKAFNYMFDQRNFRRQARDKYTDRQWRHHRWAYCRLTEVVDREIQIILDAIRQSGEEENTLVIFSSDHGDNDASHRLEHKTTFYEESANIPFMAMWKGQIPPGQVDDSRLVSNGLDLLPTVCDYAQIKGASDTRGKSLRPLFEGKKVKVYNAYSAKQAKLRVRLESTDLGQRFFPRLVVSDNTYMVEEWIDGLPLKKLDCSLFERAADEIKRFLSECQNSKELIQVAAHHAGAFCYFQDYLIKRLEPWRVLDYVQEFILSWQDSYEKVKDNIEIRLSHPDLSEANILLEKTGRLVVIDNELLGVGRGWILDRRNSFLKDFSGNAEAHSNRGGEKGFLDESWRLRLIGSAFDASDFKRAYTIAVDPDFQCKFS